MIRALTCSTVGVLLALIIGFESAGAQEPGEPAVRPAGADSAVSGTPVSEPAAVAADPSVGPPASTAPDDDFGIVPGDRIRLTIWREPEMTGVFHVDERGEIVLPKLGPVAIGGLSP
ncbi:MAG: hypothetical protein GWN82_02630, partial [Gemmatimonadetes bacterium]|nr:hypothetical protein [Gemmatimonadota bacterium]NIU29651.1 hypothetical protein [Gemmatimonadota bacterium]NIW62718.1 hypothetical protein [Gemmatimonadota bacterium]